MRGLATASARLRLPFLRSNGSGTPRGKKKAAFDIKEFWANHWKIIAPAGGGALLLLLVIILLVHHAGSGPSRRAVHGSATALPFEWTSESSPTLSPDAKQVAYISDLSGKTSCISGMWEPKRALR